MIVVLYCVHIKKSHNIIYYNYAKYQKYYTTSTSTSTAIPCSLIPVPP